MPRAIMKLPNFKREPYNEKLALIDLWFSAAHTDNSFYSKGKVVSVERGELVTSYRELAKRWLWGRDRVILFLKRIERDGLIQLTTSRAGTRIKVLNYPTHPTQKHSKADTLPDTKTQCLQGIAEKEPTPTRQESRQNTRQESRHENPSKINTCEENTRHPTRQNTLHKPDTNNKLNTINNSVCVIEPTTESKLLFSTEVYNQLCAEYGEDETNCRIHEMLLWASDNQTTIQNPRKMFKGWKCKHKPTGEQSNKQAGATTPTQRKAPPVKHNFKQRDYDFEKLEQKLLAH